VKEDDQMFHLINRPSAKVLAGYAAFTWACFTVAADSGPGAEPERLARRQPTVPAEYTEVPFVEDAPEPELTAAEKQRGYIIFHRPITEPVHPNTRPLAHERIETLADFATPGEFEPLTLSVFPLRELQNMRVQVSALKGPAGEIPASAVTVRLATYWNVGYPRYTSRSTYRRLPELLERVTAHSSPAKQCQRWWLRIQVPDDAKQGLYRATVTVWDDGFDQAVEIPVAFRVLGFKLKSDPAKHYSVYYYTRNSVQFQGKDERFIQTATGNDYRAMVEYGIDTIPTLYLQTDGGGEKIVLRDAAELDRMLEMGMRGPVPVTADNVIGRIYRDTTPGGRRESHWVINKMPPPEFYDKVTTLFKAFEAQRRAKGWPAFVCCPIDEVAASHKEFGWRIYRAVRAEGIRTYATKNPLAADAAVYRPYIDVWCSQPYSVPYEKIVAGDRYEDWCYPNHNAGEIKDRRVMCKGGRMTYGFGFWRSGYTTLIPWHWAWTPGRDQFDYLRGRHSGCGQRIGDDGEVIPAVYWECFREGRDDARYVYALQQALWERKGSGDAACRRAVANAKAILRETWDAIEVQQKYLAGGMWPSEEFNARRWRLAMTIDSLLKYPAVRHGSAPSVLVANTRPKPATEEIPVIERAAAEGNVESKDLGDRFSAWHNGTKEGLVELTADAGRDGKMGLRWRVAVDHETDGGEGGQYPVGWPRLARTFGQDELDMTLYDYLELLVRVDSDRDEVADDSTPLGLSIGSHKRARQFFETRRDPGDRQRVWIPIRFSVKEMIDATGLGPDAWKTISRVQLFLSESDFQHGANLSFDVAGVRLLRFKSPTISRLDAPHFVMLPDSKPPIAFEVMGTGSVTEGSHRVKASVIDSQGRIQAEIVQDLTAGRLLALDLSRLTPGRCRLNVEITTAKGEPCSQSTCEFEGLAGPTTTLLP
jgi:hypothetical protein